MFEDTMRRLESAIKSIRSSEGKNNAELLELLKTLRNEVEQLSKTHGEQAQSIARHAEMAAHEATRKERADPLIEHSVEGLSLSVQGFEASHPNLTETVNSICTILARIGI